MDREQLAQRLMATFLAELDEHVRALNRDLLALEKAGGAASREPLKTLFRTVHSLKGAARAVNVSPIEAACHRLEGLLGAARDGLLTLDAELIQLLFAFADALADARARLGEKRELAGSPVEALLPRIATAAEWGAAAGEASGQRRAAPPAAAPAEPPAAPAPHRARAGDDGVVRVKAAKLDALLARSGELLVARRRAADRQRDLAALGAAVEALRAEWVRIEKPLRTLPRPLPRRTARAVEYVREQLRQLGKDVDQVAARFQRDQRLVDQTASLLDDEVRRARMLPFGEVCEPLERTVRDLAKSAGKEAEFSCEGAAVELDRAILEGLRDPLLHLVRNAVDHGIEPGDEREAAGKPRRGRVVVAAALRGSTVEVSVSDDGRGLALDAIRDQARRRGLRVPEDERELARLVFRAGFSTAPLVTELSGRGVGLDVVRHAAERLHGAVDCSFEPGRGTRFVLTLPLTLTILRAVLVEAAGQTWAIPSAGVRRLLRARREQLATIEGREVLVLGEAPIPAASLAGVLGLPESGRRPEGALPMVVLGAGDLSVALAVEGLVGEQEIAVKSMGPRLKRVRNLAGATVLPSGRVALIVAVPELVASALGDATGSALSASFDEPGEAHRKRIVVVDDSITTRSLVKSILEAAGYEVIAAADGEEAWRVLRERGADLVVADVEMPRMDGFQLTEAIRGSSRFRDLPVVLVTALETDADRARGLEAGADAYLPKSTFDQARLLEAIAQLL